MSRLGALALGLGLLGGTARAADVAAAPLITVRATVDEDLSVVRGTLRIVGPDPVRVIDPLALLPEPEDDRTLRRTWPGLPEQGSMHIVPLDPRTWHFTTVLPRRYGDLGTAPRRSLRANGGWYPQPVDADGPVAGLWSVRVRLPDGTAGAVGDVAGEGQVEWAGWGERASLAVLRRGRITRLEGPGIEVDLLTRGRPRRALRTRLVDTVAGVRPPEESLDVVVVEAPMRRRLVRPGRGLAYVSDRAWRLTPGLKRFHDPAVARGVLEAALTTEDAVSRELAAAALVRARPTASARGLLRWFSWNPVVDAILNDRTLPFWGDVFQAPHPQDPLRDDLLEILAPHVPGTALAAQVDALGGPPATLALGTALVDGATLGEAAAQADVDATLITGARQPPREQDWRLDVDREGGTITAVRDAPDDAPPEVLTLRIDDGVEHRLVGTGPAVVVVPAEAPRRVVLDPAGTVAQTDRRGDAWPPRFTLTGAAWVNQLNPTAGFLDGYGVLWARGRDDTRNVWSAAVNVSQEDLPGLSLGWLHRRGPLQDGLNRPHRLSAWVAPGWSNPRFAAGDRAVLTVGGGLGYAWDTRVSALFPVRGRRLGVTVEGGVVPSEQTRWASVRTAATGIVSWHPRWALAGQVGAAAATGDAAQRLLWLGGSSAGLSLTPGIAVGRLRGTGRAEVRWEPVRHASVPLLGLAWLSAIQLTAGAETGALRTIEGDDAAFVGATAGVSVVADLLGANPALGGVTVGVPVVVEGLDVEPGTSPQVTVRFGQLF